MMEPTNHGTLPNRPGWRRLDCSWYRAVSAEAEVRPALVVVLDVLSKNPPEVSPAEHDHVVQALPPNRADQPLYIWVLPGRLVRRDDLRDAQSPDLPQKGVAVDPVTVS